MRKEAIEAEAVKVCDTGRKGKPKIGSTLEYVGTYSAVRHAGTKKRDNLAAKGESGPFKSYLMASDRTAHINRHGTRSFNWAVYGVGTE